ESELGFVLRPRLLFAARTFAPDLTIDDGKLRVALRRHVHLGDNETRRVRQRLRIDVGAAGNDDGAGAAAERIAARAGERRIETRRGHDSRGAESTVAADHDGG